MMSAALLFMDYISILTLSHPMSSQLCFLHFFSNKHVSKKEQKVSPHEIIQNLEIKLILEGELSSNKKTAIS